VARLRVGLAAAQAEAADLRRQLAALQVAQSSLESSLEGQQSAEAALAVQVAQVGGCTHGVRCGRVVWGAAVEARDHGRC
jgi:hypothetical protein